MKKRVFWAVAGILLLALTAAGIRTAGRVFEWDEEAGCLIVDEWVIGGKCVYAVYEDYVELRGYYSGDKDVVIPDQLMGKPVTQICVNCFWRRDDIETVQLGRNIREIKGSAFQYCEKLRYVTGDAELTHLTSNVFLGCESLERVEVGNSLIEIEYGAFCGCPNLKSIGEQPHLQHIGVRTFEEAGSLDDLSIPSTTVVDRKAFADSKWLDRHTEEFVIVGDGTLVKYNGTSDRIFIPEGVKRIDEIFPDDADIKEIYIPETTTTLFNFSLEIKNDVTVYIPASVTTIAADFSPESDDLCFLGCEDSLTIVTPGGSCAEEYAKKYGIRYVTEDYRYRDKVEELAQ